MNKYFVIDKDSGFYPISLKNINEPPEKLYCCGDVKLLNHNKMLAIIGCRKYSDYGRKVAEKFSYEIAKAGILIISGGARGIDSFAHKGAIRAKKPTIEVLGNGLDYVYPPENRELEKQIINNGGLIITEYPMGTRPNKQTFPRRNRIISGLSKGVLVVEAKEKSGSLITVEFALDQGKDIYAIPGNINCENSIGTNDLIKDGAKIITNVSDILEEF